MIYVYQIINPNNNRSYVGITNNIYNRFKQHRTASKTGKTKLSMAIRKYGWDYFQHIIVGFFESREDARKEEKKIIKKIDSYRNGYNGSPGGDGVDPDKISGEKNVFHRPEVKAKVMAALAERIEEHRERFLTNNPMLSKESRNKVRLSKIGKPRGKAVVFRQAQSLIKSGKVRGENNPSAKLSEENVREIINSPRGYGKNVKLAALYGVSVPLICKIRSRKVWGYVES